MRTPRKRATLQDRRKRKLKKQQTTVSVEQQFSLLLRSRRRKWELWEAICMTASQEWELCAGYAGEEEGNSPKPTEARNQQNTSFSKRAGNCSFPRKSLLKVPNCSLTLRSRRLHIVPMTPIIPIVFFLRSRTMETETASPSVTLCVPPPLI
jgi:hypothetical protein